MARLNISVPDPLYEATKKWRGTLNLSQICTRALEDELAAAESQRSAAKLLGSLRAPSRVEKALIERFGLTEAVVVATPQDPNGIREALGRGTAALLDQRICDDALLAVAGGRQMWSTVQHVSPRAVRATITALGIRSNDPGLLHVHPNALTTFLWLLYAPGAKAHLVSAGRFDSVWVERLPLESRPSYFVVSSCSELDTTSPFATLLGKDALAELRSRGAYGDFAYIFFDCDGKLLDPPEFKISPVAGIDHSIFSASYLRGLSQRQDARVILAAGGESKRHLIQIVLRLGLCNTLVTDHETAYHLLD